MRALYPFVVVIMAIIVISLSGCSLNPLNGLTDKPELTAQVGAENVKQTVGVTAKADASSEQKVTVKESKVGSLDSSSKKKVATIQADKVENITVQSDPLDDLPAMVFALCCMFLAGFLTGKLTNKKGA